MALTKTDITAIAKEMMKLQQQNTQIATTPKAKAKISVDTKAQMVEAYENQLDEYLAFRNKYGHNFVAVGTELKPVTLPNGKETLTLNIQEVMGSEIVTETIYAKENWSKRRDNGQSFPNKEKPYVLSGRISYKDDNGNYITTPLSVVRTPKA